MAAVVTEPVSPQAAFGLIYMDARRYPYLCGHATIGAVTTLIEAGALDVDDGDRSRSTPLRDRWRPHPLDAGRVESVAIHMVPSFVWEPTSRSRCPVSAGSRSTWSAWAVFSPWCRPQPSVSN